MITPKNFRVDTVGTRCLVYVYGDVHAHIYTCININTFVKIYEREKCINTYTCGQCVI